MSDSMGASHTPSLLLDCQAPVRSSRPSTSVVDDATALMKTTMMHVDDDDNDDNVLPSNLCS